MTSLLEIGPGSSPIINDNLTGSDWLGYVDGGEYTAVQPQDYRGTSCYRFPLELIALPRVQFIDAPIEKAMLPDSYFDEVFAANVLCDPGAMRWDILEHAARVVKPNGVLSFLDVATPEYAPSREQLQAFLGEICRETTYVRLQQADDTDNYYTGLTEEWVAHVGPYQRHTRRLGTKGTQRIDSTFIQFQKL